MEIILKRSHANVKKPRHLQKNIFILYSPRTVKIEPVTFKRIDTATIDFYQKIQKDLSHLYLEGAKLANLTVSIKNYG